MSEENKLKRGPKVKYDGGYKQHNNEEKYHLKYYHEHKCKLPCKFISPNSNGHSWIKMSS